MKFVCWVTGHFQSRRLCRHCKFAEGFDVLSMSVTTRTQKRIKWSSTYNACIFSKRRYLFIQKKIIFKMSQECFVTGE